MLGKISQIPLILAVFVALLVQQALGSFGAFSHTCWGIVLRDEHTLEAWCSHQETFGNGMLRTNLDLNRVLGYTTQNLLYWILDSGNYTAQGCNGCYLKDTTEIWCQCPGGETWMNLDDEVSNRDGHLQCLGIQGDLLGSISAPPF